jgi:hypothetical protein
MDPIMLMMSGILLGMPTIIYGMRNPRAGGEPLGSTRIALMTLSFMGLLLITSAAVLVIGS